MVTSIIDFAKMSSCCASSSERLVSRIFSNLMNDLADLWRSTRQLRHHGVWHRDWEMLDSTTHAALCCCPYQPIVDTFVHTIDELKQWAEMLLMQLVPACRRRHLLTSNTKTSQYKRAWSGAVLTGFEQMRPLRQTHDWKVEIRSLCSSCNVCPAISTLKHTFSSWMRSWTHDFEKVIILRSIPLTPFKQLNNKPRLCGLQLISSLLLLLSNLTWQVISTLHIWNLILDIWNWKPIYVGYQLLCCTICGSLDPCGCNLALERPDFHWAFSGETGLWEGVCIRHK